MWGCLDLWPTRSRQPGVFFRGRVTAAPKGRRPLSDPPFGSVGACPWWYLAAWLQLCSRCFPPGGRPARQQRHRQDRRHPVRQHPDNEPHVGCVFQVDFYGYDEGNFFATVRFTVNPPTGNAILLDNDRVFIGEDAAAGGTDLDAEKTYDLSALLQPFMAHPQQGYHIKLRVKAPDSIGADTKYKTFWVESCDVYPPTTTTPPPTTPSGY